MYQIYQIYFEYIKYIFKCSFKITPILNTHLLIIKNLLLKTTKEFVEVL